MNLFSLLDLGYRRYPQEGAIFCGSDVFCNWAQLRDRALRLSSWLGCTTAKAARVAIASKNCPEYLEIMFATWAAGHVIVPINAKLHEREMVQIIYDADAVIVFASPDIAALLTGMLSGAHGQRRVVEIGGDEYHALLESPAGEPAEIAAEALAWLFFTSGTTGRSKGAMLSHRNLGAMTLAHLADFETIEQSHAIVHAAPMSHGSGLYILPYLARAARQVIPASGGFDAVEFLDLCDCHTGVGAFLAPTMLQRLRIEAERSARRPAKLRSIIYGGGPMYLEELKKSLRVFGPIFCHLYGQGEAPMTITGLRRADHESDDDSVLNSVGWPRSGMEVAVVDNEGRRLPIGEVGNIVCRGDVVMSGYWNDPEATAAALVDGWLHTGDLGLLDIDGKLFLRDRSKDLIISGGSNIYPREVEEVLLTCPGVTEVSVIGEFDPEWGERVVAFVVRDAEKDAPDEITLDAHCLLRIARFKRPKRYIFVECLPKNSTGKVLKRELSSMLSKLPSNTIREWRETQTQQPSMPIRIGPPTIHQP